MYYNYDNAINELRSTGYGSAGFNVVSSPAFYLGKQIPNKKVLYRNDTQEYLNLVSSKYRVVEHHQMIDTLRDIIEASNLNTNGIQEEITIDTKGSKCFVKYTLPSHKIITPDQDTADLTFLGVNSFDGTFAFYLSVGARQSACMNGQVFTSGAATLYKSRHCPALSLDKGSELLQNGVNVLDNENHKWHIWSKTSLEDPRDAYNMFAKAAGFRNLTDYLSSEKSSKAFDYMRKQYYEIYRPRLGTNYWAVYNSLTDWSTHAEGTKKSNNLTLLKMRRASKVAETLKEFPLAA